MSPRAPTALSLRLRPPSVARITGSNPLDGLKGQSQKRSLASVPSVRGCMSGRRSHIRFVVSPPSHGVVRVLSDVEIESVGRDDVSLISREAAAVDERMILEVPGPDADVMVPGQVTESRPVIVESAVRHFVRLRVPDGGVARRELDQFARMEGDDYRARGSAHYGADRRLAVVVREFAVRLVNCSRSGCLFEADRPLEVGTVGTLSLVMEGHELADHVLVVRCQAIAGAGPVHHIGARLLWVEAPSAHTIRRGLAPIENPV